MRSLVVLILAFALVLCRTAFAQSPPPATPPAAADEPSAPATDEAKKKEEARAHFEKGVALLDEEAWEPALAEFLSAREIVPTRASTKNAAICLLKLGRYDEALELFEELEAFPNLSADDRALADRSIKDLSKNKVGTIVIRGSEPGATIVIDGRNRGTFPPKGPIRAKAGPRVVRISKEGFLPFETQVVVAGGQAHVVDAPLQTLRQSGRLRVAEQSGRALDVLVDGAVVGKTPWEGALAIGEHTVLLRGEGRLGTQPASVTVQLDATTPLTLVAEELASDLRVDPVPPGARVAIDSVPVGHGVWEGRMRAGAHRVDVAAEGFVPASRAVSLAPGARDVVHIELDRDPSSPLWHKPARIGLELDGAPLIVPSFGGDVAGGCSDGCSRSVGLGVRASLVATYELPSGLGFGLEAGFVRAAESVDGRAATLQPVGKPALTGVVNDSLGLTGFLVGAVTSLHVGERFPLLFRLGAGALVSAMHDERRGQFTASDRRFTTELATSSPSSTFVFVDPEVRIGIRPTSRLELSAGVDALVLFALSQPRWDDRIEVNAGPDGLGTYHADALTGSVVLGLAPGLGVRYDF